MSPTTDPIARRRSGAADFLRAFAIIGVVVIHVSAPACRQDVGSLNWFLALFWSSVTRASVPIFLMVTGALMLDPAREVGLKELWSRRIPRLLLALLAWAFVYKVYLLRSGLSAPALVQAVKDVLAFHHQNHLYYLHIALLVYALLPAVRLIAAHAEKRTLEYLLVLWALLGIVYPAVKGVWPLTLLYGIPTQYGLNLAYASVGYSLLGWYLRQYAAVPWRWALTAAAGFLLTCGGTAVLSLRKGALSEALLEGASPGVALLGAGICGWAFSALRDKSAPAAVRLLAKASFCVYLVHLFPMWKLSEFGINAAAGPSFVLIPLVTAAVLACSLAVWAILSRIPIVRDWLI